MGSNFEITFVSEKHVVEDDVLFTNHLAGTRTIKAKVSPHGDGHGSKKWL